MKTTIDISDALFEQARAQAKVRGVTLRALVESGLRVVLNQVDAQKPRPAMRDFSFGKGSCGQTFESQSDPTQWRELGNRQWEWRDGELIRLDLQNPDTQ
jgi:hypothetical protein